MLFFLFHTDTNELREVRSSLQGIDFAVAAKMGYTWITGSDISSFEHAERIASAATELNKSTIYLPIENTSIVPRYDVIAAPKVGDKVSYYLNGDSYPCGTITSVSPSYRRIATSTDRVFFRRRRTALWMNGPWLLLIGYVDQRAMEV